MLKRLLILCTVLLPLALHAAFDPVGVKMTASVNKTSLTLEDELLLTVTVEGAVGDFMPQLPSIPAFNVYNRATIQQITNFHAVTTFEYVMLPRFPGKTTIGPITLQYANKTYRTDPIAVSVYRTPQQPAKNPARNTPAAKAPAQTPDDMPTLERTQYNQAAKQGKKNYFMTASVSNKNPYANETVTLSVRFYYVRPFVGSAPYTAPTVSNLFIEEINRSEGRQTIDGQMYTYTEIRYALSGVTAGTATVGPATIKYTPAGRLDLSVFDRMFAALGQEPETAQSPELQLNVRPVPTQNQPTSFYGAVGSGYSVTAALEPQEVEAGEAVNLTVTVNGPGNLKPLSDFRLPNLPGFKTYDVVATSGTVPNNGALKSYKIYKTVIVPVSSGKYTVPALDWSYFDPQLKEYRTLRTQPQTLIVRPSTKTGQDFDFGARSHLGDGFTQLTQDIRYLKTAPAPKPTAWAKLAGWAYLLGFGGLFIILGALVGVLLGHSATLADKRALAQASARLKNARTAEEISDTLSGYLQTHYGVSTASLPLRDIAAALKKRGCPQPLVNEFETLWQRLNAARFAPVDLQGSGTAELAAQTHQLLKQMDKGGKA